MHSHVDNVATTVPNATSVPTATTTVNGSPIAPTSMTIPLIPSVSYAKPFPDISKIEVFDGRNFKRWQERIFSIFDVHGVAFALIDSKPDDVKMLKPWMHANKVCRHIIISTLSNELFDVYSPYKKAKQIWESMIVKYTAKDVEKQNCKASYGVSKCHIWCYDPYRAILRQSGWGLMELVGCLCMLVAVYCVTVNLRSGEERRIDSGMVYYCQRKDYDSLRNALSR
ncbi:Gag-pol polyprotein-like protein [Theobroma cacao]|uniref:Gag-pol polyprotein-like protein n=1 Tax=Theobroma cacao TaxID=3641 RepID=A0A061GPE6_THECC|nr:Gag-pol polyprotein-like protein [Theobroma cacao]